MSEGREVVRESPPALTPDSASPPVPEPPTMPPSSARADPARTTLTQRVQRWWKVAATVGAAVVAIANFIPTINNGLQWLLGTRELRSAVDDLEKRQDVEAQRHAIQRIGEIVAARPRRATDAYKAVARYIAEHARPVGDTARPCARTLPPRQSTADTALISAIALFRSLKLSAPQPFTLDARDLRAQSFAGADLRGVSFAGSCLTHASFADATLDSARFTGAMLDSAQFERSRARSAQFTRSTGRTITFTNALLDTAHFENAKLEHAEFAFAHLAGASFEGARLDFAVFRSAILDTVDFRGASLRGVLIRDQLDGMDSRHVVRARFDDGTAVTTEDREWLRHHGACFETIVRDSAGRVIRIDVDPNCQQKPQ